MRVHIVAILLFLGAGTLSFAPSRNFQSIKSYADAANAIHQQAHLSLFTNDDKLATANRYTLLFSSKEDIQFNLEFPTPKVTSNTPISTETASMKSIMEARGLLLEIETAAEQARNYLIYLEEVAVVVRAFVSSKSSLLATPELERVQEAKDYLVNIEKATASASEYLDYLEGMAGSIKTYLQKFEEQYQAGAASEYGVKQAQEATIHMHDLEETAVAAKNYLNYLRNVASVVQQYLVDPNLEGIQFPDQPADVKNMEAFMSGSARATHSIGTHPPKVMPPPAPALEVDDTEGPRPVQRIAALPMDIVNQAFEIAAESVAAVTSDDDFVESLPSTASSAASPDSYLDSLRSVSNDQPQKIVSGGNMAYLDSIASAPRDAVTGSAVGGYLDSIAPSLETNYAGSSGSSLGNYLDTINDPTPQHRSGTTPTSHFKESADSTPFSEVGPPGRGRSDVSHMDHMDPPAAPTTSSYLDQMSSSTTIGRTPAQQASGPTSYLDQMSSPTTMASHQGGGPTSYLDQMSSSAEPIDWSQVKASEPPPAASAPSEPTHGSGPTSYLDQMGTAAEPVDWSQVKAQEEDEPAPVVTSSPATPVQGTGPTSYLDQMSAAPEPVDWSQVKASEPPATSAPAAPTHGSGPTSYLDSMSTTAEPVDWSQVKASEPPAASIPPVPTQGSGPTSYLDSMSVVSEPVDWSQVKAPEASKPPPAEVTSSVEPSDSTPTATNTASYLDQMSPGSTQKAAPTTASYLDQISPSSKKVAMPKAGTSYLDQLMASAQKPAAPTTQGGYLQSLHRDDGSLAPQHYASDESVDEFFAEKWEEQTAVVEQEEPVRVKVLSDQEKRDRNPFKPPGLVTLHKSLPRPVKKNGTAGGAVLLFQRDSRRARF